MIISWSVYSKLSMILFNVNYEILVLLKYWKFQANNDYNTTNFLKFVFK
ncbi:hypothetical protein RG47T_1194 [Mucilaginibacter polytrichastri]|uniref:Uncharacterized protein n=1 Tax=Mucilaginibacter polytrichastri TaxID=1302689 RepID=A0A1Q5ZVL8_9SPHI|nr:hypothetical protein RG47T_1194 [Mucilaginibacter polytrichastri]